MNAILASIVSLIIKHFSKGLLDSASIERVKNFIVSQEDKAIDNAVKHQQTADLIKSITGPISETVIDVVVKLLLLLVREPV